MDVLTFETCWALNNEKQVTWSWSIFIQLCSTNLPPYVSHTYGRLYVILINIASHRQGVFCLWLQRPLCSCVQWRRTVLAPHWVWEYHQLPKRHWHIRCWRCFGGWLPWESLPCSSLLKRRVSSFRVWVPLCQGKCSVCEVSAVDRKLFMSNLCALLFLWCQAECANVSNSYSILFLYTGYEMSWMYLGYTSACLLFPVHFCYSIVTEMFLVNPIQGVWSFYVSKLNFIG